MWKPLKHYSWKVKPLKNMHSFDKLNKLWKIKRLREEIFEIIYLKVKAVMEMGGLCLFWLKDALCLMAIQIKNVKNIEQGNISWVLMLNKG